MILLVRLYCFAIPRSLNQANCLKWVSIDLLKLLNDKKTRKPTLVLLMLELYQKYLKMTFEVPFEEVLNPDRQIAIQQTKFAGDGARESIKLPG